MILGLLRMGSSMIATRHGNSTVHPGASVGLLTVLGHSWRDGKHWRCVCQCRCGKIVCVFTHSVGKGTVSCGCYQKEVARKSQANFIKKLEAEGKIRPSKLRVSICERCGKLFYARPDRKNLHCSHECRHPNGPTKVDCGVCGKSFFPGRKNALFCSVDCANDAQRTDERRDINCKRCGKLFRTKMDHGRWPKFCCRGCFIDHAIDSVGCNSIAWKGGRFTLSDNNFTMLYQGPSPIRERPEHRIVVEKFLGRNLEEGSEPIIHLNGDNSDNRIENLYLFASHRSMLAMFSRGEFPEKTNLCWRTDGP